jgi:ABC-2 type transport system ATP-binding protein
MDEAERCHKLAILERGAMRAEGTPLELMQGIGASVVEVKANHLRQIKSQLLTFDKIKSVAQQGVRLRVLVDKSIAQPIDYIKQQMGNESLECNLAHPSLEDVFVTVTGNSIDLVNSK